MYVSECSLTVQLAPFLVPCVVSRGEFRYGRNNEIKLTSVDSTTIALTDPRMLKKEDCTPGT